jgi:hypothetical protein
MPITRIQCPRCLKPVDQDSGPAASLLDPDRDPVKSPRRLHICAGKPDAPAFGAHPAARPEPAQWPTILAVRAPAGDAAKGTFGYWFNYFWEEAITVPLHSATEKKVLTETFLAAFEPRAGGGWQPKNLDTLDNYGKLRLLRNLLHVGFERVPYGEDDAARRGVNPNKAVSATTLFLEQVQYEGRKNMKLGYRGDSRTYDQLQAGDGGFRARARTGAVAHDYGLSQPWHPYSLPVYHNAIFLRRGRNKDNCLHTAISVGVELVQLVHFPILTDATLYTLPDGPIEGWVGDTASALQARHAVRVGHDALGRFLEHDTQMYVVEISDEMKGFHTERWQRAGGKDPFPERSVDAIPLDNVLAVIVLTRRYWWRLDIGDPRKRIWQLFDVQLKELKLLPGPTEFGSRFGPVMAERLLKHLDSQCVAARNREDIRGDRERRANYLRNPRAVKVDEAAQKGSVFAAVCDTCGASFSSALKLGQHQMMTKHKQKGAE